MPSRPWGQDSFDHMPARGDRSFDGADRHRVGAAQPAEVLSFFNARQMTAPEAYISIQPERTLRMTALAQRTNATLPRLSHDVRRLEERGSSSGSLPREQPRHQRAADRPGLDVDPRRSPGHVETVRRHVIDALAPEQVGELHDITGALLEQLDPEGLLSPAPRSHPQRGALGATGR